jgi:hypothetical protein
MRFPILAVLALCLLSQLAGAAVTNTDVDLRQGGDPGWNVVSTATVNSTENTITVKLSAGAPRTVQFVSNDTAWYYRSSSGGTDLEVAKGQPLTLRFNQTTTVYFTRQSADGNLRIVPVAEPGDK